MLKTLLKNDLNSSKGYYRANNSCFSSGVITTCSGTNSCSVMLISNSDSKNCSKIYFGAISTNDCFADGVIPCCTTIIALCMFCICILWQYVLIVFIPILGSSEKKTNIWSVGSSLCATKTIRALLEGFLSLKLKTKSKTKTKIILALLTLVCHQIVL